MPYPCLHAVDDIYHLTARFVHYVHFNWPYGVEGAIIPVYLTSPAIYDESFISG